MTGYLLDTHVLLWWLSDPSRLSDEARDTIGQGENAVYLSTAAAWEMAIKKALGCLDIPGNLEEVLGKDHIEVLPIALSHALAVSDLPLHHQDPFDRMQIAQARIEDLVIITRDAVIAKYDVKVLKA
ncbi:MAG: type II toxin-antitoxin system VapC family toxin [Planctomycetes bacterium]|nr:type II toxin-antitoxin system VapC family toxin [Planctomycetota bacterium]